MKLDNKIAIVTGAGRGIGRGIALEFARDGAKVVIAARSADDVNSVAEEIKGVGSRALAIAVDVTEELSAQQIVKGTIEAFGGIDILVNNVGGSVQGDVTALSLQEWNRALQLNLNSTFLLSRYAIPHIVRRGGGSIINISSTRGLSARRANVAYGTAKAGIVQMTKNMALDYAEAGIRVNCICPGAIITERTQALIDAWGDEARFEEFLRNQNPIRQKRYRKLRKDDPDAIVGLLGGNAPMKRPGTVGEVGRVAVFLASDDASYVSGAILPVDGARSAGS